LDGVSLRHGPLEQVSVEVLASFGGADPHAVMVTLRNSVAHRSSYHLTTPVESARLIWEVGELINRVWGDRTPGGRIFPLPVERHVFVVGWAPGGTTIARTWADQLVNYQDGLDWQYIVVKAAEADEELFHFDSDFESTHYPADLLWGPGTREEAIAWLLEAQPAGDHVQHFDREFAIRSRNGKVDPPRSPGQFLGLPPDDQAGVWYLVRADLPDDAFMHARSLALANGNCDPIGPCQNCWATTLESGAWTLIASQLSGRTSARRRGVHVPAHLSRWP
jgi:hypothetical protein